MYLDKRSESLFLEVVQNPNVTNRQLEAKYDLSRYQISYSFQKINTWLAGKNLPPVMRSKNGKFILDSELAEAFSDQKKAATEYIPTEKERVNLILLMLLTHDDILSLAHFTTKIKVSKNTILRDLKQAQKELPAELDIVYSRQNGYVLIGQEWHIRKLLIQVVIDVKSMFHGAHYFFSYSSVSFQKVLDIKNVLEEIEGFMQIKFTYDQIELLPFFLATIFKRIKSNHIIEESFQIAGDSLADTKEYHMTQILLDKIGKVPENERLFITLQLLTTHIFSGDILTEKLTADLKAVTLICLDRFEKKALVSLKNKAQLVQKIMLHLKPAYYRIKYHLNLEEQWTNPFNQKFEALHFIVADAFLPLGEFIGEELPESEIFFISLFLGNGAIPQNQDGLFKPKQAIILCPSGVMTSKIMENQLIKLFPELYFHPAISVREYQFFKGSVDIVFSSIPLHGTKNVFVVEPYMNDLQQSLLRQNVLKRLFGLDTELNAVEKIMHHLEKYADIHDYKAIKNGIIDILAATPTKIKENSKKKYYLTDLLPAENIIICDSLRNYKEAIRLASQPLLLNGAITANYVRAMIANHDFENPYTTLGKYLSIPHASPSTGVNRLSISFLFIKKGVWVSKHEKVHFIIVIAPIDTKQHIDALYQIVHLAEDEKLMQTLIQNFSTNTLLEVIQNLKEE